MVSVMKNKVGTITLDEDNNQYSINLKNGEGVFHLPGGIPRNEVINAVVNIHSKGEIKNEFKKYYKRSHGGELRIPKGSNNLLWGRPKDGTLIQFAQSILSNKDEIQERIIKKWPILGEPYSKENYDEILELKSPVKIFLKESGYDVRVRSERKEDTQTIFSSAFLKVQKENTELREDLMNKERECCDLQETLSRRSYLTVLPKDKAVVDFINSLELGENGLPLCPLCGSEMHLYQVGQSGMQDNRGRLMIACSNTCYNENYLQKNPNKKMRDAWRGDGRCQFRHPIDLLTWVLFNSAIKEYIAKNKSKFYDLSNENFVPKNYHEKYTSFLESCSYYQNQK